MKKTILILVVLLFTFNVKSQQFNFSDSAVISLLTCSPGEEVYAHFGHTGIRVNDSATETDLVFNYGIFSFETKHFYYKFIKGETDYLLGLQQTAHFLSEYEARNSVVWEQILNLTTSEKQNLLNALVDNYRPENRVYRYNFVFDNCATRPRDKVLNHINGYVQLQNTTESKTFRQWIANYVGHDTWLKFGIDLVFGMVADNSTKQFESLFLPEVLMNEFEQAKIVTKDNSNNRKLVASTKVLVEGEIEDPEAKILILEPFFIFSVLLVLGVLLSIYEKRKEKYFKLFDSLLLLASGFAGIIVFYLMFISIHPLVKYNLNILWLNPFNILAAIIIWIKPFRAYLFVYQLLNLILLVFALITLAVSVQSFNAVAFPFIVLLLIRYSMWVVRTKHRIFRKSKFLIKSNS